MKSFTEFLTEEQLTEKLLLINNGKKYGQIIILAGGAGSGKGFASSNFINSADYKIRDVDELKKSFLKMDKLYKKYPEIKDLNLRNPQDVSKLHLFVDKMKTSDKTLMNQISTMTNPDILPNILFDVTFKNTKSMDRVIPELLSKGYKKENIHLAWVLTDYTVAVSANRERERVVPDDVLLDTHEGAADNMWSIVNNGKLPKYINGGVYVILNNRKNTIFFNVKDGKNFRTKKTSTKLDKVKTNTPQKYGSIGSKGETSAVIKDFKYITFKEPKKSPNSNAKIKLQLWSWITDNIPMTDKTDHIWNAK